AANWMRLLSPVISHSMLIVTNGDSAVSVLKKAGIPGHIFPWRDVLHQGPVPATESLEALSDIRADYIAGLGWGSRDRVRQDFRLRDRKLESARHHDELVLWFEHDLYDQLQLLQILSYLAVAPPEDTVMSMVCRDTFLTQAPAELLGEWFEDRPPLDDGQIAVGQLAWQGFTQPTPDAWAALLDDETSALPFLADAIERHLEEFPGPTDGLSRTERQILIAVEQGHTTPGALFRATQEMEEAAFMGDASFWDTLAGLVLGAAPLLAAAWEFRLPNGPRPEPGFLRQPLDFTTTGRDVLAGKLDWLSLHPIDKWLGGIHLGPSVWRWDPEARQLLSS
ncbi:MAG: DUF1835 domain-containing protein, partial [Acidimicrobiales bacterium]